MSSDRSRRRKEDGGDNERNVFLFPGLSAPSSSVRSRTIQTSLSTPARMRGVGKKDAGRDK